jgi:hypothetical protein
VSVRDPVFDFLLDLLDHGLYFFAPGDDSVTVSFFELIHCDVFTLLLFLFIFVIFEVGNSLELQYEEFVSHIVVL